MANNPSTLPDYNGQTNPPDAGYPYGSARDDVTPGDLTGTPRVAAELKDLQGFQQALLVEAGIVPSGNADKVGASQYLEAVKTIIGVASKAFEAFGAIGDGVADDTAAIQAAYAARGFAFGSEGKTYLTTKGAIDYTKVGGLGNFKIGSSVFPVGNIEQVTTLTIPEAFDYEEVFEAYLASRRIFKDVTVTIGAGSYDVDMTGRESIRYEHIDGALLTIQGASAATVTITFDFTGRSGDRLYSLGLDGNYSIKKVDGVTFDGNNYSGHADGGPTLGPGDPADPTGLKVQNGGAIEVGSDVVFRFFARNGLLINEGGYALANGVNVNNCGSDAFVASIGGALFAEGATCSAIYGDGFYADRGGDLYCYSAIANDIRKRFDGSAGDGIAAVEGGKVYASGATLTNIESDGIIIAGGAVYGDDITVGGAGLGSGGYGLRNQGGAFYGRRLDVQYSQLDNIRVENGGQFSSDGCVSKFSQTGNGLNAIEATLCVVDTGTFSDNAGDGINASNCRVSASSLVEVDRNGGWGAISRRSGIINAVGASIGGANGSGEASPAGDATSGIGDSFIYI